MGINKLAGTPWHIEKIHRKENDSRRHKKWCKYYQDGSCSKNIICNGSFYCESYEEKEITNRVDTSTRKMEVYKMEPNGDFKVKYNTDKEIVFYTIGKNIKNNAPLVNRIIEIEEGNSFILNGEEITLLKKNIFYIRKK